MKATGGDRLTLGVPAADSTADTLSYPPGALVILTGLPGAGKTTLLRRLYSLRGDEEQPVDRHGLTVIDSYQSRLRWAVKLAWAPKPLRTAVVWLTHMSRIFRAMRTGPVIAHNRGCAVPILYVLSWLAVSRGTRLHLLLLDTPADLAMAGQQTRGRVVPKAAFGRHIRRWGRLLGRVQEGDPAPAVTAHVLTRAQADRLKEVRFDR
ncbi:AAA family ATPase [Herbidospora mongoliensis]|uniref:AAA family ATPase n=1 Tax=Herbidospora mongoliensis TaxID=688067 RepID=UPI00082E0511|nr:AAA family ATPase [Herbidospora mongoliensis]